MAVKVTFRYEPEPDEVDADDPTGLTEAAFEKLTNKLLSIGADDVEVEA